MLPGLQGPSSSGSPQRVTLEPRFRVNGKHSRAKSMWGIKDSAGYFLMAFVQWKFSNISPMSLYKAWGSGRYRKWRVLRVLLCSTLQPNFLKNKVEYMRRLESRNILTAHTLLWVTLEQNCCLDFKPPLWPQEVSRKVKFFGSETITWVYNAI